MFHEHPKYSKETIKCSMEVPKIARRVSNVPHRCKMFHGAAKYSTEAVK